MKIRILIAVFFIIAVLPSGIAQIESYPDMGIVIGDSDDNSPPPNTKPNQIRFWSDGAAEAFDIATNADGNLAFYNNGDSEIMAFFHDDLEQLFIIGNDGNDDEGIYGDDALAFVDDFGDRVRLDYNGLSQINSDSWQSSLLGYQGNGGQLSLFTGQNGNPIARLGSTSANSGVGQLEIFDNNEVKVDVDANGGAGRMTLDGDNNTVNVGVWNNGPNHGWINIRDDNGTVQISMYSNSLTDRGVVECDDVIASVKNFRMPHPEDDTKDLYYACVEGPEAGAYDRGTATLENGEAFIPYSDHYSIVANANTTTIQLTPLHWDTYGLAVINKTDMGFYVRELKGGKGNFSFDWEVKSVRKGYENYKVYRPKSYLAGGPSDTNIKRSETTAIVAERAIKKGRNLKNRKVVKGDTEFKQ